MISTVKYRVLIFCVYCIKAFCCAKLDTEIKKENF